MKKASRILSVFLAVVLAFALTVPAFADGPLSVSVTDICDCSVPPIGTARIYYSDDIWAEYSVFDQPVTLTMKDGKRFRHAWLSNVTDDAIGIDINEDGTLTLPIRSAGCFAFNFEADEYDYGFAGVWGVLYLDSMLARNIDIEYIPNENSTRPATPAPGVLEPLRDGSGEFLYTVKSGDTLGRIAACFYDGNADVYKLIYERNKDTMKNADTIYAGQTITLPSYAAVHEFLHPDAETPAQPETPEQPSGEAVTYTVKSGDNLSKIAKAVYGDAAKWKAIYEANRDVLKSPSRIYPGQVLTIPAL